MKPLSITTKRMLRRAVAAFCACACVFAVSACGADETGKIRIGIKFDQPGLGFKKNGTYVGFDVDVAKYVAKKLGYSEDEIVWKESPSKQREAMLQNGDVDYIVASYSITDERKKVVDFAGPYFVAGQDLLVRKDETGIDGPKDLNGKRLCSMTGTTSAVNVKEKFAKQTQLMEQPGMAECATALLSGIVDAATTDDIILAGLARALRKSRRNWKPPRICRPRRQKSRSPQQRNPLRRKAPHILLARTQPNRQREKPQCPIKPTRKRRPSLNRKQPIR